MEKEELGWQQLEKIEKDRNSSFVQLWFFKRLYDKPGTSVTKQSLPVSEGKTHKNLLKLGVQLATL